MSIYGRGITHEYLNPDMCFTAWLISGSIGKARKRIINAGICNPESGKDPSRMGIWFSSKKSLLFQEFVRVREETQSVSETPTKEEFENALKIFQKTVDEYHAKFG